MILTDGNKLASTDKIFPQWFFFEAIICSDKNIFFGTRFFFVNRWNSLLKCLISNRSKNTKYWFGLTRKMILGVTCKAVTHQVLETTSKKCTFSRNFQVYKLWSLSVVIVYSLKHSWLLLSTILAITDYCNFYHCLTITGNYYLWFQWDC